MGRFVALICCLGLIALASAAGGGAAATKFKTPSNPGVDLGHSVGGVSINHRRRTVVTRFGKPATSIAYKKKGTFCDVWPRLGVTVCFRRIDGEVPSAVPEGRAGERVKIYNGKVIFISVVSPLFHNPAGLGVGSELTVVQSSAPKVEEVDWGAVYDQPPTIRAVSTTQAGSERSTYWLFEGRGTADDPSLAMTFKFGLPEYMPGLKDYLESQVSESGD